MSYADLGNAQQRIADLEAEVQALRADALRYRFLLGWLEEQDLLKVMYAAIDATSARWRQR